ncbi:copper amine oxidase N-terminal domain-containing protein [Paenibacillus sp. p3-SID1389]|uniref:copper amine oxidase N-terminal domain-containing protein n=1 Tax=Paenibacillus sp. p3-SID1389 TaxID=2916364 RepID=UPI0021A6DA82|nr:copper amine oxidase N-terminal domain-containing protein [Paenibacillus sp. p3-SID1389]MCT2195563.1 copper amine oxidase N-terminal domain-containing protein [Paenibacillus sp. p3-SID1389]
MKKILTFLLAGSICFGVVLSGDSVMAAAIQGKPNLAVLVDGRKIKFQGGDPFMENGRVQVPLRGVGEALGAKVEFNGAEKKVKYTKGDKSIELTIGSKQALVDGQSVAMDTAAKAIKGRTYVPLRFVSENLGESVSWDQVANWVWIGSKEIPNIEDIEVTTTSLDSYKKWLSYGTLDGKKAVRIFTIDDLPLKIGNIIVYDVWKVTQGTNTGVRIRYSVGDASIFYLTGDSYRKFRTDIEALKIKNSDGTITRTYHTTSTYDYYIDNDKNYKKFKLSQVQYIGITGFTSDYVELLKSPF